MTDHRIICASGTIAAPAEVVFEQIADPSRQIAWDGNDNLAESAEGQRVHALDDVFVTWTTNGHERHNRIVEFEEGRLIAWRPSEPEAAEPGHLWRWELRPLEDGSTEVTHTYDWTELTEEKRLPRARATTSEWLQASIDRLAALFG